MQKRNLKQFSFDEFEDFMRELGWPKYRAQQLLDWVYKKRVSRFDEMTNLSKSDRALLEARAGVGEPQLVRRQHSTDGTQKFLFRLSDGQEVESVLIPDEDRNTLCISTQVGCTLDCTFCLTGTMGLIRNLKAHEIVDQVLWVLRHLESDNPLTNIVLMGMGEPLANYREVIEALKRLTHPKMVALSPRRITLSTSGLVPQIKKLGESGLNVNLAISLNATTNAVRDRLMPAVNKQYPLETLLRACRDYPLPPRRRIFFEYVLLKGVNDSDTDAHRLLRLLKGIRCKVNLIPFNDYPGSPFGRPDDETVLRFQNILIEGHLTAFIRKSRGRDILAACGQLRTETAAPALINSLS
ncbi:MAG TPA: 23S rRNA (adenine(2503)-C(2))-methyltransferase RlmN [Nitrospiria bacterium]|nr:23S rRNA (adenine(2503)-C(2))-methyltransferase RlmN [Nitrospiria bacterium]